MLITIITHYYSLQEYRKGSRESLSVYMYQSILMHSSMMAGCERKLPNFTHKGAYILIGEGVLSVIWMCTIIKLTQYGLSYCFASIKFVFQGESINGDEYV